jgi:hypothetical protein
MPNLLSTEEFQIVSMAIPADLASGATVGAWVDMRGYGRLSIVVLKAAGTAGENVNFTLQQATDKNGGSAKALAFNPHGVDYKRGTLMASIGGTFAGVQQFANTALAAGATIWTDATSSNQQGIYVFDVLPNMLDSANGFNHVNILLPDVGTGAQLACVIGILSEPRYRSGPLPSAIA